MHEAVGGHKGFGVGRSAHAAPALCDETVIFHGYFRGFGAEV
jgi:hypothetical protein